jgi:hypothetical protein
MLAVQLNAKSVRRAIETIRTTGPDNIAAIL